MCAQHGSDQESEGTQQVVREIRGLVEQVRGGRRDAEIVLNGADGAEREILEAVNELVRAINEQQVVVSRRHDVVRFSPHLYNQPDDIEQALQLVDQLL